MKNLLKITLCTLLTIGLTEYTNAIGIEPTQSIETNKTSINENNPQKSGVPVHEAPIAVTATHEAPPAYTAEDAASYQKSLNKSTTPSTDGMNLGVPKVYKKAGDEYGEKIIMPETTYTTYPSGAKIQNRQTYTRNSKTGELISTNVYEGNSGKLLRKYDAQGKEITPPTITMQLKNLYNSLFSSPTPAKK